MNLEDETRSKIESLIGSNEVMLFMKGNRQMPQCGFSSKVVQILDGLIPDYHTLDVLSNPDIRDGIKVFSSWPTVPQLYVKGEFIGGCDIIQELYSSGELHEKLGIQLDLEARPQITISDEAAEALRQAIAGAGGGADGNGRELHLAVDAHFQATLAMAPRSPHDIEIDANGVPLLVDALSAQRADGVTIETVESPRGTGFKIENPNAPDSAGS